MSVQIFLQGKLLGIERFLPSDAPTGQPAGQALVAGRAHWAALLSEVLPRALLAELGLARILLGSSGGGNFFLVLPAEAVPQAEAFLKAANEAIRETGGGMLRLVWAGTENLGDWTIVRKRLAEEMWRRENTVPVAEGSFAPRSIGSAAADSAYFSDYLAPRVREARTFGWSPDTPGRVLIDEGKHTWAAGTADGITVARHAALDDAGHTATVEELAQRAPGHAMWGILRGAVDGFRIRLRRAQTIEEYLQLTLQFQQFFAGELEVACSMPDFWRKVSVLWSGEDDFAVYGTWDALLQLAREMQRLFHRFAEANLKELPGPEGKTITMALELAPEVDAPFGLVFEAAGRSLDIAKAADKDCLQIFGRTVEWRHVNHASDLKELMMRMVRQYDCPPEFLSELSAFYREKPSGRADRPWRYYRRLAVVLGEHKDRELQRLQKALITDIVGKSSTQVKLRPAGRVAVEWARLLAGPVCTIEETPTPAALQTNGAATVRERSETPTVDAVAPELAPTESEEIEQSPVTAETTAPAQEQPSPSDAEPASNLETEQGA
ncbi:MAG: hypothetical protein IT168_10370 [Bryobacterales bacterium]|nr:hypothetical protein [Bryobacterales bacterium]